MVYGLVTSYPVHVRGVNDPQVRPTPVASTSVSLLPMLSFSKASISLCTSQVFLSMAVALGVLFHIAFGKLLKSPNRQ